ncbi:MAG: TetR/AcrR family transcriptional regulator [Acidimicrobiia bacterium]|nr:TetR/AcrR family transcriptional regulator [Acidimicrobiia bacterium]
MSGAGETPRTTRDRRRLRGERNRVRVMDALLALLEEGRERPTARQIAERAGLSPRTVFQHFDDLDTLYSSLADRQTAKVASLLRPVPVAGTLAERIAALVEQRARVFETIAPVRRAALVAASDSPLLAARLAQGDEIMRQRVEIVFAAELGRLGEDVRRTLLDALDVATCFATWDVLRRRRRCSVEEARAVVELALRGAVTAASGC